MKTTLKIIFFLGLVLLCIGFTYLPDRFSYKVIRTRNISAPGTELRIAIDKSFNPKEKALQNIMDWSNEFVANRMTYKLHVRGGINPNHIWKNGVGDCASYAALQVSVLNYIFTKYNVNAKAEWHYANVYYANQHLLQPLSTHCYPLVKANDTIYYPDACYKDLFFIGYLVSKEEK